MNKFFLTLLVIILATSIMFVSCAAPTQAPSTPTPTTPSPSAEPTVEPITLNWVTFLFENDPMTSIFKKFFIDKVNEQAQGKLTLDFRGGSEAIASADQGVAVQKGIVDISFLPSAFYEPLVPGLGGCALSQLTPAEERQNGAYEFMLDMHKKAGLYYLGRGGPSKEPYFYTVLKKKVTEADEFAGLKLAGSKVSQAAVKAWGASFVNVPPSDYYTALEQGIADGLANTALPGMVSSGYHEVTKFAIDHPYYAPTLMVIVNLDSFNKLPSDLQNLMIEGMIQAENDSLEAEAVARANARKAAEEAGVEFYKLSSGVAEWYLDTAYDAAWEELQNSFPDVTGQFRELITK